MFRFTQGLFAFVLIFASTQAADPEKPSEELLTMAKDLKDKSAKVRLKAVQAIEAKGTKAQPIARQLCDAMMDKNPDVALAALTAVEKVQPELYKPLAKLFLDSNFDHRALAVEELGKMKAKAAPTAGILIQLTMYPLSNPSPPNANYGLCTRAFESLVSVDPEDPQTIKTLKAFASSTNSDSGLRRIGIQAIVKWAGEEEDRRKEVVPILKQSLDHVILSVECIKIAGSYGAVAKPLLPQLKTLKLSASGQVREAAEIAVGQIEKE